MANKHTDFWMELLKFGDTEEERRKNWNIYCNERYRGFCRQFAAPEVLKSIRDALNLGGISGEKKDAFNELANTYGGHPQMPDGAAASSQSLMDFSGRTFEDDISFAGRLLIKADFRETVFEQNANFRDTVFLSTTEFGNAKFRGAKTELTDGVWFTGSTFHNTVRFNAAEFTYKTKFDRVTFHGAAYFRDSKFEPKIGKMEIPFGYMDFEESRFVLEANFSDAIFGVGVIFKNAEFQSAAKFDKTKFRGHITFNNARFQGTTSFRNAVFDKPPEFFETELHEDVDFSRADWSGAERSYDRSRRQPDPPDIVEQDAGDAVRAWDRLALIMSQREKLPERHEFFRLRMRAQRQRDGRCLLSLVNWLFDVSSDHGWGVGRAFAWWIGHMVVGALILATAALTARPWSEPDHCLIVWNSLLVSFANSLAFLRLGSEGGYLNGPREALMETAAQADWVFSTVGTIQAVFGPILLFLVLLTLRNRFRLG